MALTKCMGEDEKGEKSKNLALHTYSSLGHFLTTGKSVSWTGYCTCEVEDKEQEEFWLK